MEGSLPTAADYANADVSALQQGEKSRAIEMAKLVRDVEALKREVFGAPELVLTLEKMLEEMNALVESLTTRVQFGIRSKDFGPRTYDAGFVEGLSLATLELKDLIERWESR
jgi:hypothetical protein